MRSPVKVTSALSLELIGVVDQGLTRPKFLSKIPLNRECLLFIFITAGIGVNQQLIYSEGDTLISTSS